MDIIETNLQQKSNSFLEILSEKCFFDNSKFSELTDFIFELNRSNITHYERLEKSIQLWEIGFSVEKLISFHYDNGDIYKIENLSGDQIRQLTQIIYYMCNWFSYSKLMEKDLLCFGKW